MSTLSRKSAVLGLLFGYLLVVSPANADDWTKYENAYFEAYSDASRRSIARDLEELENFRAAAAQFLAFQTPDDAPKAQVLIFRSAEDMAEITGNRSIRSFMTSIDGTPYIVMQGGARGDWTKSSVRHEMIHVLLRYNPHRLPPWYREGIAEFMSSTEFRDGDTKFTIGNPIDREIVRAPPVPWDELMDDDFRFHTAETAPGVSNARRQAWQLVHFLAIGNQFEHYENLGKYLGRYSAGELSYEALENVFGMTPQQVGDLSTQSFEGSIPYYAIAFDEDVRDHDFIMTEADYEQIRPAIEVFKARWGASRN
ncbi:MAG: DUF1570 domain-containing protein [Gammaproteobacteria bacterium]|nr:DUF1570 domain-containing protein [Gammaproteobacteria bacterium]